MNINNYDLSNPKELEQMCQDAARGCYAPPTTQMQHAMSLVIQNLALPSHVDGFTVEILANNILGKMHIAAAVRGVISGRKK
jgi:hypothetical protein